MKFEIFHQLGWRYKWSIDTLKNEQIGDGVIISPRSMNKEEVDELDSFIKRKAILDPQLFNPREVNKKMATYDFYPALIVKGGYATGNYKEHSPISANVCVDYQINNDFRYMVIPTRYFDGLPPVADFIKVQNEHFVDPFIKNINSKGIDKDIFVQVILNVFMVKSKEFTDELLDWITGLQGIKGVYLITEYPTDDKQICDSDFLHSLLKFINVLYQNELRVILGYLNTEALVLSLANPSVISIGSFENLRRFHYSMFEDMNAEKDQRGPKPRIYVPQMLQWVEYPFVQDIVKSIPETRRWVGNNKYLDTVFQPTYKWSNNSKEPYKHYFIEGSKQLQEISVLNDADRYNAVRNMIELAKADYSKIYDNGVRLDEKSSEKHLNYWLTAINLFAKDQGWGK